jgi:post-segregation antitoxin (ccd killing protein)
MGAKTEAKIRQIQKTLLEKSEENGERNIIEEETLEKTIKVQAGYTVVDKYKDAMLERDILFDLDDGQYFIEEFRTPTGIELSGSNTQVQISVDKNIVEAANQQGLNKSQIAEEALADALMGKSEYIKHETGEEVTEREAEFIFELARRGLQNRTGDPQELAQKSRKRRKIYREMFDVEKERVEELRQAAFNYRPEW